MMFHYVPHTGVFLSLGEIFPDPGEGASDDVIAATLPFESQAFVLSLSRKYGTLRHKFK